MDALGAPSTAIGTHCMGAELRALPPAIAAPSVERAVAHERRPSGMSQSKPETARRINQ